MKKYLVVVGVGVVVAGVAGLFLVSDKKQDLRPAPQSGRESQNQKLVEVAAEAFDFSSIDGRFKFEAVLPEGFAAEKISQIQAINIYDPTAAGASNLEKSQIFVRFFEAGDFLTLQTVNILERREHVLHGHEAVTYEIEKKLQVPAFVHQPAWRSGRHRVTDVRMSRQKPATFYVFGKKPALADEAFDKFLQNIRFHNDQSSFRPPVDKPQQRVTKKPFGIHITPETSPVQPERFTGFHTGADYEIFPGEENKEVAVTAICGGALVGAQTASGYGGVVVQECLLGDEPVTVVYGHVRLASVAVKRGDYLRPGQKIAVLGTGQSAETDGQRKHLHLGIHKGRTIDIRGYVQNQNELSSWLDPANLWN